MESQANKRALRRNLYKKIHAFLVYYKLYIYLLYINFTIKAVY